MESGTSLRPMARWHVMSIVMVTGLVQAVHGLTSTRQPGDRMLRAGGSVMIPDGMLRVRRLLLMAGATALTQTDTGSNKVKEYFCELGASLNGGAPF